MIQEKAQVLWNRGIGSACYKIGLKCRDDFSAAIPGQFIMVRPAEKMDPLLRRPFSIHQLVAKNGVFEGLELLFKVVGAGTQKISRCKPGDILDILGPLGKGFSIPDGVQRIFIVAGGVGIAPVPFLISNLIRKGIDPAGCKLFLGGKSKDDLLCLEDFSNLGICACATTDDGSFGDQCLVTDPVEIELARCRPDIIYACGPMGMLTCVIGMAENHGIPCQVSIETMMACGMGACLGCAVESRKEPDKYLHACLDGPVFDARDLKI
jgi:dihydroorotate dehydrogenase electron transfer subunit